MANKLTFKIATLLTCHNRKDKTLNCLNALFNNSLPNNCINEIFLVDDGSTDGTGEAVKAKFPEVKVIQGNGALYWNQGMRLAWSTAVQKDEYDYFFWLNDDTMLFNNALNEFWESFYETQKIQNKPVIIVGACSRENATDFSYGGRTDAGPVIPNGEIQECKYINGNAVLVPKIIYQELGTLSPDYTHTMGDFDYGLRTIRAGFKCFTTRRYIAICSLNEGIPSWCNPEIPVLKRWHLLHSPKGLNLKEYILFRKKFWGSKWLIYAIKAYLRALLPKVYFKLSNNQKDL